MNQRIQELAEQVGFDLYSEEKKAMAQEFAELIVRECAGAADDWYQNHEQLHWDPATHILAHFGVE